MPALIGISILPPSTSFLFSLFLLLPRFLIPFLFSFPFSSSQGCSGKGWKRKERESVGSPPPLLLLSFAINAIRIGSRAKIRLCLFIPCWRLVSSLPTLLPLPSRVSKVVSEKHGKPIPRYPGGGEREREWESFPYPFPSTYLGQSPVSSSSRKEIFHNKTTFLSSPFFLHIIECFVKFFLFPSSFGSGGGSLLCGRPFRVLCFLSLSASFRRHPPLSPFPFLLFQSPFGQLKHD